MICGLSSVTGSWSLYIFGPYFWAAQNSLLVPLYSREGRHLSDFYLQNSTTYTKTIYRLEEQYVFLISGWAAPFKSHQNLLINVVRMFTDKCRCVVCMLDEQQNKTTGLLWCKCAHMLLLIVCVSFTFTLSWCVKCYSRYTKCKCSSVHGDLAWELECPAQTKYRVW